LNLKLYLNKINTTLLKPTTISLVLACLHSLAKLIMWLDKKIYVVFDDSQQIQWRALLYTLTVDRATIYNTKRKTLLIMLRGK
jgi:hypothetical protein